jgi:hypothetical protein
MKYLECSISPCKLIDCPPGFFLYKGEVFFKTEYGCETYDMEVYCSSGEVFWGGAKTKEERANLNVFSMKMF